MTVIGVFVLLTLAVARLTRIATVDRIGLSLRRWVINRYGTESAQAYLIVCTWCTSVWIAWPAAIAWVITTMPWTWWWLFVPGALAMSHVTGLLSRLEEQ